MCKKGVLKNFASFTGKHLCCSLLFDKVAALFIKKETTAHALSYDFLEKKINNLKKRLKNELPVKHWIETKMHSPMVAHQGQAPYAKDSYF